MIGPEDRAAIPVLVRELGIFKAIRIGFRLDRRKRRGEPFQELAPPENDDERMSREQIGPAIVLYDELTKIMPQPEAYKITERVVIAATLVFLRRTIGPIEQEKLEALDDDERRSWLHGLGQKFFNATIQWDRVGAREVAFTVTRCRFPQLCAEVGFPELAPVFCQGDAHFFGTVEKNVRLDRPQTIAEGAHSCPFALRWVDEPLAADATADDTMNS